LEPTNYLDLEGRVQGLPKKKGGGMKKGRGPLQSKECFLNREHKGKGRGGDSDNTKKKGGGLKEEKYSYSSTSKKHWGGRGQKEKRHTLQKHQEKKH